ncbi:MAG TPA: hypothetical protein VK151_16420 [Fluviicola sp.]|nr:hypothetical protein [Fluviicola sp.]
MKQTNTTTTETKPRLFDFTSLQFWKNNLSLIVIIPYVLGGIWQIIELSNISLTYIRFFSVTQSVSDGLLMLIILFLVISSWTVIKRRDVTERIVRKWLMVDDKIDVDTIVYLITLLLAGFLLSPIWIALYNISMAANDRNSLFFFY